MRSLLMAKWERHTDYFYHMVQQHKQWCWSDDPVHSKNNVKRVLINLFHCFTTFKTPPASNLSLWHRSATNNPGTSEQQSVNLETQEKDDHRPDKVRKLHDKIDFSLTRWESIDSLMILSSCFKSNGSREVIVNHLPTCFYSGKTRLLVQC